MSHDHFQGGHYTFAMARAPIERSVTIPGFEDVEVGIVKWPLSVLRIRHRDDKRLTELAVHVLEAWRRYTDEAAFIFAETDGEPHNTITPIARMRDGLFELDLTLRNNITDGGTSTGCLIILIAQYHHIKRKYRLDRSDGTGGASIPIKRGTGAFGGIYPGRERMWLPMRKLRSMPPGWLNSFRKYETVDREKY